MLRETSDTQMVKAEVIDQEAIACVMDDYQGNLELRGKQYAESKQQVEYEDEEEDDDDPYKSPDPTKEPTTRAVSAYLMNLNAEYEIRWRLTLLPRACSGKYQTGDRRFIKQTFVP